MSEVKVNKLSPRSGTTITIGDSGDTVTIPSGVTLAPGGDLTLTGALSVDGASATIKLDGDYPTGTQNVALGDQALSSGSLSGGYNVAVGSTALKTNTSGAKNVAIGRDALELNTTGCENTAVGQSALSSTTTGTYNTGVGYNAQSSAATSSNQFTLGDANVYNLRCNDTSISSLSDSRDKTDVIDSPYGLDFINTVRPVQFKWESRDGNVKDGSTRIGFLAQELLAATDGNNAVLDLVLEDNPEKLEAKYGNLLPIAIQAIQELSAQVEALTARIETLEG